MRKILVTGASGIIGLSIIKNLLNRRSDYYVRALANYNNDFFTTLDKNRFSFVQGDCRQYSLIDSLIADSDAVIHLAAPASFLMYKEKPIESTINTIQIFLNIMESMKKHRVDKIVHASTSAVYEGLSLPYRETMIIDPPELKSLSKKTNEDIGRIYSAAYGIKSIAMRPMSVYGDDESKKGGYANIISLFVWAMVGGKSPVVWGDGNQTRDFIHADDTAEAFCLALEKDISTQPINVGTGMETSFNDIIKTINSLLNTDLKQKYVDIPIDVYAQRLLSDNTILRKELGFEPKISIREGVERVIKKAELKTETDKDLSSQQMYFETLKR